MIHISSFLYFYIFFLIFMTSLVLGLVVGRVDHELWSDVLVKVGFTNDLELEGGLLEGEAVLVGVLGSLAGGVVADDGVEAGNQHQTGFELA